VQEVAASELRAAIVRGDYPPGAKIPQEETARVFRVSLIPLREAMRTLAGEGLLTYEPQRGYFVSQISSDSLRQIFEARALIEGEIERVAIPRLASEDTRALRAHLLAHERAAESRDAVGMIDANRLFHFTIFAACENTWLLRCVTQLWDAIDPYRARAYERMWIEDEERVIPTEILAEHAEILDALERRARKQALRLLAGHRERGEALFNLLGQTADRGES
jgi:DNA-binding GntR family transcriptional regulator